MGLSQLNSDRLIFMSTFPTKKMYTERGKRDICRPTTTKMDDHGFVVCLIAEALGSVQNISISPFWKFPVVEAIRQQDRTCGCG